MYICHDLKKEASIVAPPLPNAARLIPVLFYLALAGCLFFVAYSLMQINDAQKSKTSWQAEEVKEKKKLSDVQSQTTTLETDLKKVGSMISWLRAAQPVQPLVATITNSIQEETKLNELDLKRSIESPWQLNLLLRINNSQMSNNSGTEQLDEILAKLRNDNFREIPQGKQISTEHVEYKAMLLFPSKNYE